MKCGYCDGTGEHINDANRMTTCEFCGGTGVIKPMTNEEYLCTCSTEERAKFLTEVILSDRRFRMTMVGGIEETKAWLKEIYNA